MSETAEPTEADLAAAAKLLAGEINTVNLEDGPEIGYNDHSPYIAGGWMPPDSQRVPINIHPDVRSRLQSILEFDPRLQGVGYSQFIESAIRQWEQSSGLGYESATKTFTPPPVIYKGQRLDSSQVQAQVMLDQMDKELAEISGLKDLLEKPTIEAPSSNFNQTVTDLVNKKMEEILVQGTNVRYERRA